MNSVPDPILGMLVLGLVCMIVIGVVKSLIRRERR